MIRRILVPLYDLTAAQPLLSAAQRSFPLAQLHLLHVLETPFRPVITAPEGAMAELFVSQSLQDTVQTRAAEAREALAQLGRGEVAVTGDPASEILRRSPNYDLVLMGTRGRRGLERCLLGSVAERVVRESPVPVLTVPSQLDRPPRALRRLLFIRDFSPTAQRAQEYLNTHWAQANVEVLHVTPDLAPALYLAHNPLAFGVLYEQSYETLRAQQAKVQAQGGRLVCGDAAQVALQQLEPGEFDLLVIGTEARSPLERFFQGSVVGQLIRDAQLPVLTLRHSLSGSSDERLSA